MELPYTAKEWTNIIDGVEIHYQLVLREANILTHPWLIWDENADDFVDDDYYCGYASFPECPLPKKGLDPVKHEIDVHGGKSGNVTFAEWKDGRYVYGFDCGHKHDDDDPQLKDIDWLTAECESMAHQIMGMAKMGDEDDA